MKTKFAKEITPPFIWNNLKRLRKQKYGWIGNYNSWAEASKDATGYDSDVIIEKVTEALLKVKNGETAYERDGGLFDKIQYSYPLLASLLWIAGNNNNELNLIDFGGSLGSSYYQNRKMLEHLSNIKWSIVEQRKFVEEGKHLFQDKNLKFFYSIEECMSKLKPNILLILGTIEYIEKPFELLEKLLSYNFEYIVFDRTPFINADRDILTLQVVPPKTYEASYPCWMFNETKFLKCFRDYYNLIYKFESGFERIQIGKYNAIHKGFLLREK